MEKLELLVSAPVAREEQTYSGRTWLRRHWDVLALLLLMLMALPVQWFFPGTLYLSGTGLDFIDESWHLDTSFKAASGVWFGRDVAFTYGPLFQWLASAPARWRGFSMGALYVTSTLLPCWCAFLAAYLTLLLLLPEQPPWKRFVLLLLLGLFWLPWEGRTPFAALAFALFLRGWYAVWQQALNPILLGCGAAFACAVAFLYSGDTGAYAVAALLVSLAGVVWESLLRGKTTDSRQQQPLRAYAWALLAFLVMLFAFVIVINAFMAKPLDFRFWKNSLAILSSYRWMEPTSMSKAGKLRLLVASVAAGFVFLLRGITVRQDDNSITARSGFLVSGLVFALFAMQTGMVRSDTLHIEIAVYVAVLLTGVVLFSFASRAGTAVAVVSVVAASWLFGNTLLMRIARQNYGQLASPLTECPGGFLPFDRVCYPGEFTRLLQNTGGFLQQRSGPRDSIVIFPFHTIFGIAARRNVAGGVMQSYLASGPYLSQVDIAGLERAAAPAGLFVPDNDRSWLVDGVPNLTRSPEVWLWTFRHYRSAQEMQRGIVGLERDDNRAGMTMQSQPLKIAAGTYPIRTRSAVVDLGDVGWPLLGADFLRLRLKVHYPFWWKLRKPSRLELEIERGDSTTERKRFIIEPNITSEIWFYPWDDAELAHYFAADENQWRTTPQPAITRLRLLVNPLDWVSVQPESIEVQSVEAVTFTTN